MVLILDYIIRYAVACWDTLVDMAPYIGLGFLMAGFLHIFVSPQAIVKYLGKGRISSVIYAALFGVPLPLCSCAVLPTVTSLKKQGANNGAALSFLISTPESGVDSIAVTYALLDPLMTIFRPLAAFVTGVVAGLIENFFGNSYDAALSDSQQTVKQACKVDNCCAGDDCPPEVHNKHHTFREKLVAGLRYGFGEILDDIASWLLIGVAIAGLITVVIPETWFERYLGGGITSMLIMLAVGIPLYICATGSTPIAAAMILKGISPGAALVFLLAGPATNAATISVVYGLFKKRATIIYLTSIAVCSVAMGLLLDVIYRQFGISAKAIAGQASEFLPHWFSVVCALALIALMSKSLWQRWQRRRAGQTDSCGCATGHDSCCNRDVEHGHCCD